MARFVDAQWDDLTAFFNQSSASYSVPKPDSKSQRVLVITPHHKLQEVKYSRLSSYRFVACTDIARFYHSIYTHSISWAFHRKGRAKAIRGRRSSLLFDRADSIIRNGQDGQSIGIPVGPDTSRVFAEVIATAIDLEFEQRSAGIECTLLRHVDDVWIGAHTHADAEMALTRYREAIREFELDINENKTEILSDDFGFSDSWPSEIAAQIEFAVDSNNARSRHRLRAALERFFGLAVERKDDGILRYILQYLDQNQLSNDHWKVVEPFLRRSSVHFGHTIDLVARILIWRHLAKGDLDIGSWRPILSKTLDDHGRLGNDSEVCWTLYVHSILKTAIPRECAKNIVMNCGALSLVALLHSFREGLVQRSVIPDALTRVTGETDGGPFWPVLLEWKTRRWPRYQQIELTNETIQDLARSGACIYDPSILTAAFRGLDTHEFPDVKSAIEQGSSVYGKEDEEGDEVQGDDEDQGNDEEEEDEYPF